MMDVNQKFELSEYDVAFVFPLREYALTEGICFVKSSI